MYSDNTSKSTKVQLSNQASIRKFFPQDLIHYAHNCFVPLPIPRLSVEEIQSTPVHKFAYNFAIARGSLSVSEPVSVYRDVFSAYKPSNTKAIVLCDRLSDEAVFMSNISSGRTVDINWTAIGGGKTVGTYMVVVTYPFVWPNVVCITGRLADGSTLLNVVLNQRKMRVISEEVQRILEEAK